MLEVVGTPVLVIGVLPDVVAKQNALPVNQRAVLIGPRFDRKLSIWGNGDEYAAWAESGTRRVKTVRCRGGRDRPRPWWDGEADERLCV
jgi:hypothetical protein